MLLKLAWTMWSGSHIKTSAHAADSSALFRRHCRSILSSLRHTVSLSLYFTHSPTFIHTHTHTNFFFFNCVRQKKKNRKQFWIPVLASERVCYLFGMSRCFFTRLDRSAVVWSKHVFFSAIASSLHYVTLHFFLFISLIHIHTNDTCTRCAQDKIFIYFVRQKKKKNANCKSERMRPVRRNLILFYAFRS